MSRELDGPDEVLYSGDEEFGFGVSVDEHITPEDTAILAERSLDRLQVAQEIWNEALKCQNERISQSRAAITKLLKQMVELKTIKLSQWDFESFGEVKMRLGSR